MEKVVPIFYTEYGRYMSRFRAIPFYADCLIPVQRRLLLSLHEIAKGPKTVKSAKIVGHVIGSYHPHGDAAAYGSLVSLYKQGFIDKQGNFGSPGIVDANASSMRYTEAKIKKWIEDFCFKYIDFVQWENYEYEVEPLFLPGPLPIGLIGDGGIFMGVAFHKCVMPRYKMSDLAKRLKWLLSPETEEVIIYPNLERDGCTVDPDIERAKQILNTGIGSLAIIPNGKIDKGALHVLGKVPQTSYHGKSGLLKDDSIHVKDLSGKTLDIQIKPSRKTTDLNAFFNNIYNKYLIKNINYNICVCDEEGKVTTKGVDELLLTCYNYYLQIVKYKLINDCNKEIEKKFENEIILMIRNIIKNNPTIKTVDEIIQTFRTKSITAKITTVIESFDFENDKWISTSREILDDDIKNICTNRNIKALIEHQINISTNDAKINDIKTQINNNDVTCYKLICDMAAKV